MRIKASFVVDEKRKNTCFKGPHFTTAEQLSRGIQYPPCAEWVAEPNGIALKTSYKKGLVK